MTRMITGSVSFVEQKVSDIEGFVVNSDVAIGLVTTRVDFVVYHNGTSIRLDSAFNWFIGDHSRLEVPSAGNSLQKILA